MTQNCEYIEHIAFLSLVKIMCVKVVQSPEVRPRGPGNLRSVITIHVVSKIHGQHIDVKGPEYRFYFNFINID